MNKNTVHQLDDWKFNFIEGGLSCSNQIDKIAERCKLFRPPTIIFGDNICEIQNIKKDIKIIYNAQYALQFINYKYRKDNYINENDKQSKLINSVCYIPEKLQIKHAKKWKNLEKPKDVEINSIEEISDSFFITPFRGKIQGAKLNIEFVQTNVIPLQKLGPENIMKFYQQASLYQDELDDNGLIQYQYKFRAMQTSWFALIRCYVRVDQVIIMILDTRLYWQKGWQKISRQFMMKKATWQQIKNKQNQLPNGWTMNPNQSHLIYPLLNNIITRNQYIHF